MSKNDIIPQQERQAIAEWQKRETQTKALNTVKTPTPKRELRIGEPCVIMRYTKDGILMWTNIMYYRGVCGNGQRLFGVLPIGRCQHIHNSDLVVPYSEYSPYHINSNQDKAI